MPLVYGWTVTSRTVARTLVVLVVAATSTVVGAVAVIPAYASGVVPPEGSEGVGEGLSVFETIGYFVLAPLALFALITLAVLGPSMGRGARHRTGAAFESGPVWVGHGGTEPVLGDPSQTEPASDRGDRGGASGRW